MTGDPRPVHVPVLAGEVLALLAPRDDGRIVDLTVGAGGHAERILQATRTGRLVGIDQDPEILDAARRRLAPFGDRVLLLHGNFADAADLLAGASIDLGPGADGVLADLGVSSLQLDRAERGFSFDRDGPLDMRMDPRATRSAADLVNHGTRDELLHAIGELGDEPRARRVVAAIVEARRVAPLRRTCELSELVARVLGTGGPGRHHPATRTFMGLRMAVNDEPGALAKGLAAAIDLLRDGGVAAVISFHGGEDRIVKQCFRDEERRDRVTSLTRRPVTPERDEVRGNPRARSARLRAVGRIGPGS